MYTDLTECPRTEDGSHQGTVRDHASRGLRSLSMPFLRTHLLLVELLGLLVEGGALLDDGESLDVECLPCCLDGGDPWALLLQHDLALLVLHEVTLGKATPREREFTDPDVVPLQLCVGMRHTSGLLHRRHSRHGRHGLHRRGRHCRGERRAVEKGER